MLRSALGFRGGVTAPHRIAAMAGQEILNAGGTAVEAIVSAAATIAVVYPHMNGIGGDAFWLIKFKNQEPIALSGCGRAAKLATPDWYSSSGYKKEIPVRGGAAALTIPGAVSSWDKALRLKKSNFTIRELLNNAIHYAGHGFAITENQAFTTENKIVELKDIPGFANSFLNSMRPPVSGSKQKQEALKSTLTYLGDAGLNSFYRGDLARTHSTFLEKNGSPLRFQDFFEYNAEFENPIQSKISKGEIFNIAPPTQGITSLMILSMFDRLNIKKLRDYEYLHNLIEITKQALTLRNSQLADPDYMVSDASSWLESDFLGKLLNNIDQKRASPWPSNPDNGDTVWLGAVDKFGTVVSFIQSVFWEFGSALTCPETGVFFQNRGAGFSLAEGPNQLQPLKKPLHTLNPALAVLKDGKVMAFGTMGGDGQPQTQSAIFSRYTYYNIDLQESITMPRWLLGRTWGEMDTSLKLERRFSEDLIEKLSALGHKVELIEPFSSLVGHAGAIVLNSDGLIEGASDPRSDGSALVF